MLWNRVVLTAGSVFIAVSTSAARFTPTQKTTCSLLTTTEASTALGQQSHAGVTEFDTGCVWSQDAPPRDTSRQLHVEFHDIRAYDIAKHGNAITKIEPVAGVGDDAFYQLYPNGASPFIWVKKGNQSISIRVMQRRKDPPFTEAELKSKLLVLGKAAVARM